MFVLLGYLHIDIEPCDYEGNKIGDDDAVQEPQKLVCQTSYICISMIFVASIIPISIIMFLNRTVST